jgi:hypothetical protein
VGRLVLLLVLVGCYKEHTFGDCELSCTAALGCPTGLTCLGGMCRMDGATGACSASAIDAPMDVMLSGIDSDGDGIDNAIDNCLAVMNADQADEDADGKGDVCDPCPIGPQPQDDLDHDDDGVGNGCDPNDDTVNKDRILLFEGFNNGALPGAARFGDSPGTVTDGAMRLVSNGTFTGYAWDQPATAQLAITTKVTVNPTGTNTYFAGTVDHIDPATGAGGGACANKYEPPNGVRYFAFVNTVDGSSPTSGIVSDSDFLEGGAYKITEQRVNGAERCNRDDVSGTGFGSFQTSGSSVGIGTRGTPATFEYVLIVGH